MLKYHGTELVCTPYKRTVKGGNKYSYHEGTFLGTVQEGSPYDDDEHELQLSRPASTTGNRGSRGNQYSRQDVESGRMDSPD